MSSTRSRRCARLSFLRAVRYFGSCFTTTPSLVAAVRAAASVVRRFSSFSTSGLAFATSSGDGRSFLAIFFGMVALVLRVAGRHFYQPPRRGPTHGTASHCRSRSRLWTARPRRPLRSLQPALREADAVRLHDRLGIQADPFPNRAGAIEAARHDAVLHALSGQPPIAGPGGPTH